MQHNLSLLNKLHKYEQKYPWAIFGVLITVILAVIGIMIGIAASPKNIQLIIYHFAIFFILLIVFLFIILIIKKIVFYYISKRYLLAKLSLRLTDEEFNYFRNYLEFILTMKSSFVSALGFPLDADLYSKIPWETYFLKINEDTCFKPWFTDILSLVTGIDSANINIEFESEKCSGLGSSINANADGKITDYRISHEQFTRCIRLFREYKIFKFNMKTNTYDDIIA